MPAAGHIRLGAFCDLIGQPKETIRAAIYGDRFPIREWEGEGQRTFDGRDLFAYEVYVAMTGAGIEQARAAEDVNFSYACESFLKAMAEGDGVRDLCLLADADAERDPLFGYQEISGALTIRAAEVGEYIARRIEPHAPYRRTGRDADTIPLGLRRVTVIPLWQCWKLAQARAEAAGYQLADRHLMPITPKTEGSE